MKKRWQWILTLALALFAGSAAFADDSKASSSASGGKDGDSQKSLTPPPAGQGDGVEFQGFSIPSRLRSELPQQLVDDLAKYQAASEKYIMDRKALDATLKGATSEERKKIREQLRKLGDTFRSDTRDLRNEIQNQIHDLNHRPVDGGKPGRPGGKPRH